MGKRIAIHGKTFQAENQATVENIFNLLKEKQCQIAVSSDFAEILKSQNCFSDSFEIYSTEKGPSNPDFVWSIGGDGTLLETLTHVKEHEFPILGINTGRLGFLATVSPNQVNIALDHLLNGDFTIENRTLVKVSSPNNLFSNVQVALNEVGIMKTDSSSMIVIKAFLNGEYLNTYWADGLIVSTATGSTGYSLSVGGPLVMPTSENFIIAPMSPHNLNVRPLVIPSNSKLRFEISSRSQNFLVSLDSRSKTVDGNVAIEVESAPYFAKLIKIPGDDFLQTLRSKLNWGLDVRN
ncbi:NAD kinase [Sandaracinomonas limnophila]|uniref:NAD kinase n=1 Tax=Sandaracinomonas limnophila TaxID=1862386 RepID=A0A437PR83_9BACT|nr:NAD kinase [Sandaracinomonas limnophila]RVU24758.1 NAD kinase [Sandaracinomonas limnophila]